MSCFQSRTAKNANQSSSATSNKAAAYQRLFDTIFKHAPLRLLLVQRVEYADYIVKLIADRSAAMINDPHISMRLPYMNDKFATAKAKVMAALSIVASARRKPLLATVRGPGMGKTRFLEELRFCLLNDKDTAEETAVLGFTFNGANPIEPMERELPSEQISPKVATDLQLRVAISITLIRRLAAALYSDGPRLPFAEVSRIPVNEPDIPMLMILGFLRHAVARLREVKPRLNKLVVMVDESKLIGGVFTGVDDPFKALRHAVLTEQIAENVNAALVMTSLDAKIIIPSEWEMISGRPVVTLPLASKLPVAGILKSWGQQLDSKYWSALAEATSTVPRLVEIVKVACDAPDKPTNYEDIVTLYPKLDAEIGERYGREPLAKDMLRDVVFSRPRVLGQSEIDAMQSGVFINAVEVSVKPGIVEILVPEANLLLLSAIASPRVPFASYTQVLKKFLYQLRPRSDGGIVMEYMYYWWFLLRLSVLAGEQSVSLREVLGVPPPAEIPGGLLSPMMNALAAVELTVPADSIFLDAVCQIPSWQDYISPDEEATVSKQKRKPRWKASLRFASRGRHQTTEKFLEPMSGLNQEPHIGIAIYRGHPFDAFDWMLLVRDKQGKPFIVFVDPKNYERQWRLATDQATHMRGVAEAARTRPELNGEFVRALADGRYAYIYVVAKRFEHDKADKTPSRAHKDCIVLHGNAVKQFFGPLWSLFSAATVFVSQNSR